MVVDWVAQGYVIGAILVGCVVPISARVCATVKKRVRRRNWLFGGWKMVKARVKQGTTTMQRLFAACCRQLDEFAIVVPGGQAGDAAYRRRRR